MSEELYGNGIYLDESFDLSVDNTGDLRSSKGVNELEKDLSFRMADELSDLLGSPEGRNFGPKLRSRAKSIALDDERVETVIDSRVSVNKIENTPESNDAEYELILPVVATTEQTELVINL